MKFDDNKAGMVGLDKEKIEKIIAENTSANFDSHAQKKQRRIEKRISHNNEILKTITDEALKQSEDEIDPLVSLIESERRLDRIHVHIDMDAFFAAVEMRDDPRLRNIPMAVGSDAMLSTSNYLARQFGVRSAMPGFIAKNSVQHSRLCMETIRSTVGKVK